MKSAIKEKVKHFYAMVLEDYAYLGYEKIIDGPDGRIWEYKLGDLLSSWTEKDGKIILHTPTMFSYGIDDLYRMISGSTEGCAWQLKIVKDAVTTFLPNTRFLHFDMVCDEYSIEAHKDRLYRFDGEIVI